jgi:type IV pilus assembly protein PilX
MSLPLKNLKPGPAAQQGVSLVVALIMLLVLTLIGVSSMNTAVVELKMAGSMQQQGLALNRADEALSVGENDVEAIVANPGIFDFGSGGDGYYLIDEDIDVFKIDWPGQGLTSIVGANPEDSYVIEYIGKKDIPEESQSEGGDEAAAGGFVYTFRITSRSATGKNAVRLVQSIYVTEDAP